MKIHNIFFRYTIKLGEQGEQGEHPRQYWLFLFPEQKTMGEQGEQITKMFPVFPEQKTMGEQKHPRQYWLFPAFPLFPVKTCISVPQTVKGQSC